MSIFQIQIPDNVNITDFELRMLIASKLFESGKLSSGQASEIVGISKRTFIELMGKFGVSLFGYSYDELEEGLENA